jgi:hypothetical protein
MQMTLGVSFCLALALLGIFCASSAKKFALRPPKAQALKTSGAQHFWRAEAPKQRGTLCVVVEPWRNHRNHPSLASIHNHVGILSM